MSTFFDWSVEIAGVNVSQWVKAGGTIDYGRKSVATGFQAPVAQFEVFTKDENPNPAPTTWPEIHVGDPVIIHTTWTGYTQSRRFTGIVQALDYSLYRLRVTATGNGTDWGRAWSGTTLDTGGFPLPIDPSVPIQNENDRVSRWVGLAGQTITIEGAAARWLRAVPANTTGMPLLDLILRIADDCDGLLMEDRLGVMHYRTRNFARPARVVIPPGIVESTSIDAVIERGSMINSVTVYYGEPDPTTGIQPSVYASDSASIAEYGPHRAELYTDIQYDQGAAGKALKFLEKNRLGWQVPDVTLLMNQASGAEADWILQLQENWRVAISPLPDGSPIGAFDGDILGITEVMHETDYRVILHLGMPVGDAAAPPEEPIFPADSLTGGTTYEVEDQFAFRWQVHEFDTPGDYTLTCVHDVLVEALVVAAGGPGGFGNFYNSGGGGGAGALFDSVLPFTPGTIAVKVGAGGVPASSGGGVASPGGDSQLAGVVVFGGGFGGSGGPQGGSTGNAGGPGGFGGGGGAVLGAPGAGTHGTIDGTPDTTRILGGPGQTLTQGNAAGWGGGASYGSEITGTVVAYAEPGQPGDPYTPNTGPGSGGDGAYLGTAPATAGLPGAVIVRYRIG